MGQKMAQVPEMIREDFRRAGLSHALAASGIPSVGVAQQRAAHGRAAAGAAVGAGGLW